MSKFGMPTDDQLSKINKLAKRQLSKDEVFVFPSKLAGDMIIPNRYIQLTKELLDTFSVDANKGVSLLLDHSWKADGIFGLGGRPKAAIPYGRTFDSRYEASTEEGETISLVADHYMVKGVEIDGIKTDDLIVSIEAGTLFDTSIGFNYSKMTCSVCEEDYRKCDHYLGRTYEIEESDGVTRQRLCYVKAKPPGALWENSLVFDGAYPGAGVLSKDGDVIENESGIYQVVNEVKGIDPVKPLLATYSERTGLITLVKKSDHKKPYNLGKISDEKVPKTLGEVHGNALRNVLKGVGKSMDEKALKMLEALGISYSENDTMEELLSKITEKWDTVTQAITNGAEPLKGYLTAESIECLADDFSAMPVAEIKEKLGKDVSADELLKLAKEGQAYRESLIKDALAMGVRAMANDFDSETWKATFEIMYTEQIQKIMKNFEKQAMENIPDGRKTNLEDGQGQAHSAVPDEAYKVGR